MSLWKLSDICAAVGVNMAWPEAEVGSVHADSRTVKKGGLFVALQGQTQHGNDFVPEAVANGAGVILTDKPVVGVDVPQLVVPNSMVGFRALAEAARARFKGPVVAITGSAGKTTTTRFLAVLLEGYAPPGSFNNHVGVPFTLCNLPSHAPAFVAEVGMNKPGEIAPLVKLVKPHVALVVNVLPVHVEGLGSLEGIRREKLSIAEGLEAGGTLVVPEGLDLAGVRNDIQVVRFNPTAPLQANIADASPARIACANAALAAARVLGDITPAMLARMADVPAEAGRGGAEVVAGITLIDDSFNGNPASVAAALQALAGRVVEGRKVALLGDMLELGAGAVGYHEGLLPYTAPLDGVVCVGPLMRHLYQKLQPTQQWGYHENPTEVDYAALVQKLKAGDALLVKGSKKMLYVQNAVGKVKDELKRR